MRDTLPLNSAIWKNEAGIVNLDSIYGQGTHWVCYVKHENKINYFDSFGNLKPPTELINYFSSSIEHPIEISYNYTRKQKLGSVNCGHLCLQFLANNVFFKRQRT